MNFQNLKKKDGENDEMVFFSSDNMKSNIYVAKKNYSSESFNNKHIMKKTQHLYNMDEIKNKNKNKSKNVSDSTNENNHTNHNNNINKYDGLNSMTINIKDILDTKNDKRDYYINVLENVLSALKENRTYNSKDLNISKENENANGHIRSNSYTDTSSILLNRKIPEISGEKENYENLHQ